MYVSIKGEVSHALSLPSLNLIKNIRTKNLLGKRWAVPTLKKLQPNTTAMQKKKDKNGRSR